MRVETRSLQPKGLWPLAIALFATPVIFYQYFNGNWWMSVCCIFAYLTQFVCVFGKADDLAFQSFDTSRPEYDLGDNREKAYELQSLLNVIIARNKR